MALIHAHCFGPGTVFPIWQATDGGTLLDGDDGDDVDGNTRWGVQVDQNEFAGQHYGDFAINMCDGDTTGKIRLGVSFKVVNPGSDGENLGVGKYVCWEEIASHVAGGGVNPDKWGWGLDIAAGPIAKLALFWYDNSAATWNHVATSGVALILNTWYYVTIEFDCTNVTDSNENIAEGAEFADDDVTLTVDNGGTFTVKDIIVIDTEKLRVSAIAGNNLTVVRGVLGTTAAAHADESDIYFWTPTAALYATTAVGEVLSVAAQAEHADWDGYGNGRYMGGWEYINIQESGKGEHNLRFRMCNAQVLDDSDPNGDGFFTSRVAWLDRSVVMARVINDIEKDWTPHGGPDCYGAVDNWAREVACGTAGDNIASTADDQQWLGDVIDVANVRGVILMQLGQADFYAHNTLGGDGESAVGELTAEQTGVGPGASTVRTHRLRQTPDTVAGPNPWSDARFNAFRAGLDADAGGYACLQFGVICVGDTGTALVWPTKRSCAAEEGANVSQVIGPL